MNRKQMYLVFNVEDRTSESIPGKPLPRNDNSKFLDNKISIIRKFTKFDEDTTPPKKTEGKFKPKFGRDFTSNPV